MKNLALFDLDGTLFNTTKVNYHAYNEALKEKGYSIDYTYYSNYCNGRHYNDFLPEIVDNNEKTIEYIHKRKKELYSSYLDKAKINSHLFNIIESLKETYYIGIVTTASKKNTHDILNYFNKLELFDLILTSDDITKLKPDPEGYIKAMKYFKIEPENTIIFEDSEVGIKAAKASKATVFVVNKF